MSVRILGTVAAALGLLGGAGCDDGRAWDQAVCVLIDESGTYADERREVVRILKREVLPALEPGDTMLVIRIDGESYEEDNLVSLVTLDPRPSKANAQKLSLAQALDRMAEREARAAHTDIPGAMMLATEYLAELESGSRVMLVFSDMQEDLPPGAARELDPDEFAGIHVAAMNVKRLGADNADPTFFRGRLAMWERRVMEAGGAGWRTVLDATKLPGYLEEIRERRG